MSSTSSHTNLQSKNKKQTTTTNKTKRQQRLCQINTIHQYQGLQKLNWQTWEERIRISSIRQNCTIRPHHKYHFSSFTSLQKKKTLKVEQKAQVPLTFKHTKTKIQDSDGECRHTNNKQTKIYWIYNTNWGTRKQNINFLNVSLKKITSCFYAVSLVAFSSIQVKTKNKTKTVWLVRSRKHETRHRRI